MNNLVKLKKIDGYYMYVNPAHVIALRSKSLNQYSESTEMLVAGGLTYDLAGSPRDNAEFINNPDGA